MIIRRLIMIIRRLIMITRRLIPDTLFHNENHSKEVTAKDAKNVKICSGYASSSFALFARLRSHLICERWYDGCYPPSLSRFFGASCSSACASASTSGMRPANGFPAHAARIPSASIFAAFVPGNQWPAFPMRL